MTRANVFYFSRLHQTLTCSSFSVGDKWACAGDRGACSVALIDTRPHPACVLVLSGDFPRLHFLQASNGLIEGANKNDASNRRKVQGRIHNLRDIVAVVKMNKNSLSELVCAIIMALENLAPMGRLRQSM